MQTDIRIHGRVAVALMCAFVAQAKADAVIDWSVKAGEIVVESKLGTPPAIRAMAIVQTAVHEAVKTINDPVSLDAAVAAANRTTLAKLLPAQQASIEAAYHAALAQVPDGPAKAAAIAAGERAAAAVLARRADDSPSTSEAYRPRTAAGIYVPTAAPAASQWAQRKPWLMTHAAQFRPAAPPALTSETWARDYNEVKAFGAKASSQRSAEQTEIARFWEYSLPPIYHGVVRALAGQPGRTAQHNARLFAAVTQAMDDALIGVFDAKYHYDFWRPATAIRNGDIDGHDATERDASWAPLIDAPMTPEYPSAHAILAGAVTAVLKADVGRGATPVFSTTSPSAKGAMRRWTNLDDFAHEVAMARVYEGIHYRTSTEVGIAMGRQIGELAVAKHLQMPH